MYIQVSPRIHCKVSSKELFNNIQNICIWSLIYTGEDITCKKVHFIIIYSTFCSVNSFPKAQFIVERDRNFWKKNFKDNKIYVYNNLQFYYFFLDSNKYCDSWGNVTREICNFFLFGNLQKLQLKKKQNSFYCLRFNLW